ncbi:uncharacterized protein [Typha latifolia]|uniref:uncharacterized protein n=1 Tax=Typha latifolia TaxID=4733 RepID=UPI003C2C9433
MKQVYDQRHQEKSFSIGDLVYIKLQPYRQSSIRPIPNQKLAPKFYGPYQVIEQIGPVAYHIDLPEEVRIHPVFHVSSVKARVPPAELIGAIPPEPIRADPNESEAESSTPIPVWILVKQHTRLQDEWVTKILLEWHGRTVDEATWMPESDFMDYYSDLTP